MKPKTLATTLIAILMLTISSASVFAAQIEYPPFSISGTHKIEGAEDIKSINNKYILTAKDDSPLPDGSTGGKIEVVSSANQPFDFGEIQITKPGLYEYTVTREIKPSDDIIQDDSIYHVHVAVFSDGIDVIVLEKEGEEAKPEKIEYIDKLKSSKETSDKGDVKTGDNSLLRVTSITLAAALAALLFLKITKKKED